MGPSPGYRLGPYEIVAGGSQLNYPNICALHDVCREEERSLLPLQAVLDRQAGSKRG